MENITTWHITALLAIVALIVWLVRLEAKTNSNTIDIDELYKHAADRDIHHPSDRLETIMDAVKELKSEVKTSFGKLTERIDRMLSK